MKKKSKPQRDTDALLRRLAKVDANNPLSLKDLYAIDAYVRKHLVRGCQRCWDGVFTFWKGIIPANKTGLYYLGGGKQLPCPKCGKIYK